jgi:plastocyanin
MIARAGAVFSLLPALALAAASPVAAGVVRIDASGIAFVPARVSAKVGDTVEWTNKDFVVHSATARNGDWDLNLPVHKTGQTVLKKAGKIAYYCRLHPNMTGEIDISPK